MPTGAAMLGLPAFGSILLSRLLLLSSFILAFAGAHGASAACRPITQPMFAHIPMNIAIAPDSADAELSREVSYFNANQDYYRLVVLPGNDLFAHVAIDLEYDALLVFDQEMMSGSMPKYNRYLHTYRNNDLSDQTMIIDYQFDKQGHIGFTFIQIASANARARSLLMELGLMALADFGQMTNAEFRAYYEKVDHIVEHRDDQVSRAVLDDIMKARKGVILGCLLRTD